MARLFISYKSEEKAYAFAIRQWLVKEQGWADKDVFVDKGHLSAGKEWETLLLSEAEAAEALLFLASEASIDIRSFCYRELRAARGQIIAATLKGLSVDDPRLLQALPERAKSRQIEALDQQPVEGFDFVSPQDNIHGSIALNRRQVESIGSTLRDLGIAPDSFAWTAKEEGPFPGLRPLQEGDEAIFCGRAIDIRDGLKALDDLRASVTEKALIIQAPSGAGKSSFLRAGLWQRLRRSAGFTPLAIIRTDKGAVRNPTWGLVAGLYETLTKEKSLREGLPLSRADLSARVKSDFAGLLKSFAQADAAGDQPRTLILGIDQAEEITALTTEDAAEFADLMRTIILLPAPPDIRLVLTVRDDSLDATRERLIDFGMQPEAIATWRLHRLPRTRLDEVINGPSAAARQAGWPLTIPPPLVDALAQAAGATSGEGGDALPILAVALQRLVEEHRAPDGQITLQASDAKAFLETAVENAVKKALEAADASEDDLKRLIIPRLATWDPHASGEGAAKRVVAPAERLFEGDRASLKPLADALVRQRLLTSSGTDSGAVYEVAHEALLRVAPLGQLIYERREKFEQQRMLLVEARDWRASGESASRLARSGDRLKDAEALLADVDFGQALSDEASRVTHYIAACVADQEALIEREKAREREKQQSALEAANARAEAASVAAQAARRVAQRTIAGATAALLLAVAAISFGSFAYYLLRDTQMIRSSFLARASQEYREQNQVSKALHLAWSALPHGQSILAPPPTDEALKALKEARYELRELAVIREHPATIVAVAFSPDGTLFATGARDNLVRIWDAESRTLVKKMVHDDSEERIDEGALPVTAVGFSPDSKYLVSASEGNDARVWLAAGNESKPVATLQGHTGVVTSATFGRDASRILTASRDGTARLWHSTANNGWGLEHEISPGIGILTAAALDPSGTRALLGFESGEAGLWSVENGAVLKMLEKHDAAVSAVAFSADGKHLLTASFDKKLKIWDGQGAAIQARLEGHTDKIYAALFSPDSTRVLTASADRSMRIWDMGSLAEVGVIEGHRGGVRGAAYSPDGRLILTGSEDKSARLWKAKAEGEVTAYEGHRSKVTAAHFLDSGRFVTVSGDDTGRIWDRGTGTLVNELRGHADAIVAAEISPDRRLIVTASDDDTARLWDAATGSCVGVLRGHANKVRSASFSPNNQLVVTTSADGAVYLWAAATATLMAKIDAKLPGERKDPHITTAAFSADSASVVVGTNDGRVRVWDVKSRAVAPAWGACNADCPKHEYGVSSVVVAHDGSWMLTGDYYKRAMIWDAQTGKVLYKFDLESGVSGATISPDDARAALGLDNGVVRIIDRRSGKLLGPLKVHAKSINSIVFHPDGVTLLTGSEDGTARLWNTASRVELAVLRGHRDQVKSARFSPDGQWILTASADRTARTWPHWRDAPALIAQSAAIVCRLHALDAGEAKTYVIEGIVPCESPP